MQLESPAAIIYMIRYYFIFFCFCFAQLAIGQNNNNPFNLKYNADTTSSEVIKQPANFIDSIKKPSSEDTLPPLSLEDELEGATLIQDPGPNSQESENANEIINSPNLEDTSSGAINNPFDLESQSEDTSPGITIEGAENLLPKNDQKTSKRWIFWVFLITLFLLTIAVNFNRQIISKIYRSILNSNYSNLMFREQGRNPSFLFILLYILFFINGGLFLYLTIGTFVENKPGFFSIFACIGLVSITYLLRHGILNLLGNVFPLKNATSQFGFNVMYFNIFLGLILIPINLFVAYGPEAIVKPSIIVGVVIILLLYLLRQIRGLFISRNALIFHKFHFFMYLCAVEIAPYFILVKLLYP